MYPGRVKAADWSDEEGREVSDRLTPYNWLFIQWVTVAIDGEEIEFFNLRKLPTSNTL